MNRFIQANKDGIDEIRVGTVNGIETPVYIPEVKSSEDVEVLLNHHDALDDGAPILVPGYRWQELRSQPKFSEYEVQMRSLIRNHPYIYYEPPELFRYRMPGVLKTYAFKGSRSMGGKFNKLLRDGDIEEAIDLLPTFFQPFMECQVERLLEITEGASVPDRYEGTNRKATEGWRDSRADKGYEEYFAEIVKDAQKSPDAAVVPPVPPLLQGSEQAELARIRGANMGMANICEMVNSGRFGDPVHPYFHLYVDYSVLKPNADIANKALGMLQKELGDGDYSGLALTISNYQNIWDNNMVRRLESFVTTVSNIAREHYLPVYAPRSGWYGAYLTDHGVDGFASLLNGKERYKASAGGISEKGKYGKVPTYGDTLELGLDDLITYLENTGGQMTHIPSLPDSPPQFNPAGDSPRDKFGQDRSFRVEFGKARRLLHAEEARELRKGIRQGQPTPARLYFDRSEHNDLG